MNITKTFFIPAIIMTVTLSASGFAAAQEATPHRKQEVRIFLPKPKPRFEINLPVPEPLIQIVDQIQGDIAPSLCPAPARNEPVCSINSTNASQVSNEFDLTWRCDGTLRPCALFFNGQPAGSVRGAGTAHLVLPGIIGTYELRDRNDRSCGGTVVRGFRGAPPQSATSAGFSLSGYRWFANDDSVTPGAALEALNTAPSVSLGSNSRLRMLVHISDAALAVGVVNFKLQVATKGSSCAASTYADVTTDSANTMRYLDNATPADGAAISAIAGDPTNGSNTVVVQTYEEANNFTNTSEILEGREGLWDFSLRGPAVGTYCLRVIGSDGSTFDSYSQYPEITMTSGY